MKSALRLVALVATISRRGGVVEGAQDGTLVRLPGASIRRSAPRLAQAWAR